jgi:hypothetical protein
LDGRLIHFAVGAAAIVFGAGIWTLGRVPRRNVRVAAALLALAVLAPSTLRAAKWAAQPPGREEMQTILGWLAPRVEPGDTIYVSHAADAAWLYYRERYGLGQRDWIHGRRPAAGQNTAAADAADLRGRGRVWLIFAHVQEKEDERLLHSLGVAGQPIESTAAPGASAHLYVLD